MVKRTLLGLEIEAGLKEVLAHRQGKICLKGRTIKERPGEAKERGPSKKRAAA